MSDTVEAMRRMLASIPRGTLIEDGVATGDNTVMVGSSTVAVTLPAVIPVSSGDRVIVATNDGSRVIIGPIGSVAGHGPRLVAEAHTSTLQGVGIGPTDLSGCSVTFTAVAGRSYIVHAQSIVRKKTTAASSYLLITNSANTEIASTIATLGVDDYTNLNVVSPPQTPGAGSMTYKLRGASVSGSTNYAAGTNYRSAIQVYDVT